jgi:predicted transcriptional regulator
MKANQPKKDPILIELDAIKRLLALALVKAGSPQGEIAMALDVDQSVVSRMFSARKVKPLFKPKGEC